jgi:prevent-host-death family protein
MVTPKKSSDPVLVRETAAAVERHIGIRDLKAKLSEYMRDVKSGGTVVVTEHGRPVARIIPEPTPIADRLRAMAKAGEIVWSGNAYRPGRPVARLKGARTVSDLIIEERDRE